MGQSCNAIGMNDKVKAFLKRFGIIGFLFFLIKGLIWLALLLGVSSLF